MDNDSEHCLYAALQAFCGHHWLVVTVVHIPATCRIKPALLPATCWVRAPGSSQGHFVYMAQAEGSTGYPSPSTIRAIQDSLAMSATADMVGLRGPSPTTDWVLNYSAEDMAMGPELVEMMNKLIELHLLHVVPVLADMLGALKASDLPVVALDMPHDDGGLGIGSQALRAALQSQGCSLQQMGNFGTIGQVLKASREHAPVVNTEKQEADY